MTVHLFFGFRVAHVLEVLDASFWDLLRSELLRRYFLAVIEWEKLFHKIIRVRRDDVLAASFASEGFPNLLKVYGIHGPVVVTSNPKRPRRWMRIVVLGRLVRAGEFPRAFEVCACKTCLLGLWLLRY